LDRASPTAFASSLSLPYSFLAVSKVIVAKSSKSVLAVMSSKLLTQILRSLARSASC